MNRGITITLPVLTFSLRSIVPAEEAVSSLCIEFPHANPNSSHSNGQKAEPTETPEKRVRYSKGSSEETRYSEEDRLEEGGYVCNRTPCPETA